MGCATTLAVVASGCQTPPLCNPNIVPGGRYQADLIERYDENSQYKYTNEIGLAPGDTSGSCAGPDGIGPGTSLVFQGTAVLVRMHTCAGVAADLSPPPAEITVTGPASNQDMTVEGSAALGMLAFTQNVTFGQCAGTLGLAVFPGAGTHSDDVFVAPSPGSYPHAVLFKMFAPLDHADTTCPTCYDDFVIHLSKVAGSTP